MPYLIHANDRSPAHLQFALLTQRSILTEGVAGKMPTPQVKSAADDAFRAALVVFADSVLPVEDMLAVPLWEESKEPDWLIEN